MKIKILNKEIIKNNPISIESLVNELGEKGYLAAKVNGRLRELSYILTKDSNIELLGWSDNDALKIYESTLRYVVLMALDELYPNIKVKINYSISRSILVILENYDGVINNKFVDDVNAKVQELIKKNIKIKRRRVSIGEAMNKYIEKGMIDKVEILKYRTEDYVNLYQANDYFNYMFGYMLPSTGYLTSYKMFTYRPGFLIQVPRPELNGEIPEFIDEHSYGRTLREANRWGRVIQGDTIAKINEYASRYDSSVELINISETRHNHQLNELGTKIEENIENLRLIAVAGPSSSGKTTFTTRLKIELMTRGIRPVMISIDDYYLPREQAPRHNDGTFDLEHIEALDIKRFNDDIFSLISGEAVTLPLFDFKEGTVKKGKTIKIDHDTPILIEGIHALNELLTESIPKHQKYKIYISPQTQLHIDNHNPISITELRLLRRLVRDKQFRNSSAEETLSMWPSVRAGEFRWIYPAQSEADYVFNSELTYEFAILKKIATKELEQISTDNEHFITANRLLKFLKYFKDIDPKNVPCNSILREFIGGSSFHV